MANNRWFVERVIVSFDREIQRNIAKENFSEVHNLTHAKIIIVKVLEKIDLREVLHEP